MFTIADCAASARPRESVAGRRNRHVPDKGCGGHFPFHEASKQAVAVSEDNGLTWSVRLVSTSTGNGRGKTIPPMAATKPRATHHSSRDRRTLYFAIKP